MNSKLILASSVALILGACQTMPEPNPDLERARAAVETAQSDPNVARYAALDLEAAKKDLEVAESAYAHRKYEEIPQPAYLATQNARLAQAHASAKADDARVAQGQTERERILLAARTREAENAKLAAASAQQDAAAAQQEAAAANDQAARAQAELDALKAKPSPRGTIITLGDVMFDTGQSHLKSGSVRKLDQLVSFLNEHPKRRVQIDGFTDSVGSDDYNEALSQRRADAVKAALSERGIDSTRMAAEGYGKAFPVASNNDSGGRQLNRRVEVVIGNDAGAPIAPRS